LVGNAYTDGVAKGVYEYVVQKCEMEFDEVSLVLTGSEHTSICINSIQNKTKVRKVSKPVEKS
jgi:hypothetical protein